MSLEGDSYLDLDTNRVKKKLTRILTPKKKISYSIRNNAYLTEILTKSQTISPSLDISAPDIDQLSNESS